MHYSLLIHNYCIAANWTLDIGYLCNFKLLCDRKKNIFKLAQGEYIYPSGIGYVVIAEGEYIAPNKIENVYGGCRFVALSFIYDKKITHCASKKVLIKHSDT